MSSDDPHANPDADDFDEHLLTSVDKWWEFLDPVTYQIDETAHSRGVESATADRLDWTAAREADRRGPVGFGFYHRCEDCGKSVPPDVTFCVHCGGVPAGIHRARPFTLVIKRFEDDRAVESAIELMRRGSGEVDVAELRRVVHRPPVVFNLHARKEQVAALAARMTDLGIYTRSFPMDDPSVPWVSETLEALFRAPPRLAATLAILAFTVFGTFAFSLAVLPFGLLALAFFFKMQMDWFKGRYQFSAYDLLNGVTGFDAGRGPEAADLLQTLRDEGVRGSLTIALMEFYTLHQTLQSHATMYGAAMAGTQDTLVELLDQILQSCARYQRVERFLAQARPAELESRISSLDSEIAQASGAETRGFLEREREALRGQLAAHRRLMGVAEDFRARLQAMTRQLEALRARLETMRANVSARWEDIPLERVLAELDDELVVFEQTFEDIEMTAPAMTVGR